MTPIERRSVPLSWPRPNPESGIMFEANDLDLQAQRRSSSVRTVRLTLALTVVVFLGCEENAQPPSLNVVLISIDSLRADRLLSYGYFRSTSPNLDRIAREGALFENAIAESSWTLPTHVSMLTGLSSFVHGVERDETRLAENVPTLASQLRAQGYRTKGIYSGPYLHPIFGFANGFDEYEGVFGKTALDDMSAGPESSKSAARLKATKEANRLSHRTITSPAITEKAIEFISRDSDDPFFLFLHYFDVHHDYIPPESLWRKFDPYYDGDLSGENFADNPDLHANMSRRDLDHLIALYDAEILFTDQHIGYVLDALDRNGLMERTLLVVTADHGEEFFEHGGKGHRRTLFDEVLKVPLLFRLPGRIPAGLRIEQQIRHVDVMPTILSLLGVGVETPVSGTDVASWLAGEAGDAVPDAVSRLVHGENVYVWISVRTEGYKYLVNHRPDRRREVLYDLARDPHEQEPVASRFVQGTERLDELDGLRNVLATAESRATTLRDTLGGTASDRVDVPEDVEERLRSLGYIQ